MIIANNKSVNLPFFVSALNKDDFCVNFGEINSYILQNYRYVESNKNINITPAIGNTLPYVDAGLYIGPEEPDYKTIEEGKYFFYPFRQGSSLREFFPLPKKTFSIPSAGVYNVYLSFPKIPMGFDIGTDNKLNRWYFFTNHFVNDYKIIISNDENFSEIVEKSNKYIETNNPFGPFDYPDLYIKESFRFVTDINEYYGKNLIKIATITKTNDEIIEINNLWKSNIVCPSRYIRMGYSHFTCSRLIAWYRLRGPKNDFKNRDEIFHPSFFLKSIEYIKENAKEITENFLNAFYKNYSNYTRNYYLKDFTPVFSEDDIELGITKDNTKIDQVDIYRLVLLYKENAGAPFIVEKIFEDIEKANEGLDSEIDSEFFEKEFEEDDIVNFFQTEGKKEIIDFKKE